MVMPQFPFFCPALLCGQLSRGLGLTFSAHEHVLIENPFEATQRSSLVQPAFVAAQAGPSTRSSKGTSAFFGFVPESIARNFCGFVSTHFYLFPPKYEFKGS
jgi:hypothetical protein